MRIYRFGAGSPSAVVMRFTIFTDVPRMRMRFGQMFPSTRFTSRVWSGSSKIARRTAAMGLASFFADRPATMRFR